MGYIRRPAYYKAFRCIGSDCTENCCIGWEINVDEDSLAYYETVPAILASVCARALRLRTRRPESRRIFVWTPRSGVRC